jgi:hypothetical protein
MMKYGQLGKCLISDNCLIGQDDTESFHGVPSKKALVKTTDRGNLSNRSADDRYQSNESPEQSAFPLATRDIAARIQDFTRLQH